MGDVTPFSFNPREAAAQDYRLAKQHVREALKYHDCTNADHQKRFRDALKRQEEARERYVATLMNG